MPKLVRSAVQRNLDIGRVRTLAALLGLSILFACGDSDHSDAVHDDTGRIVSLPDDVSRLASLAPNLTEIIFAAGAGDLLVAVTTADDFPPEVEGIQRISALPVDFEKLASLRPDLVLATDQVNSPRDARTLENLGIPIYYFSFRTIEDIPRATRTIGRLTGRTAEADSSADAMERSYAEMRASQRNDPPRVLFLIGLEVLYSVGEASYVNDMIAAAGGESVTRSISSPAPVLSDEFVLTSGADVIVGTFGSDFTLDDIIAARPMWRELPAVRSGRVYSLSADYFHRPGPRVFDGIRELQSILALDAEAR